MEETVAVSELSKSKNNNARKHSINIFIRGPRLPGEYNVNNTTNNIAPSCTNASFESETAVKHSPQE